MHQRFTHEIGLRGIEFPLKEQVRNKKQNDNKIKKELVKKLLIATTKIL